MNVYDVKITPQTETQLEDIIYHITVNLHNPEAAEKFLDVFDNELQKLSINPEKHRIIDEKPWNEEEIRKIVVKSYYIYYWIDVERATVWVISIVYAQRDQKKSLSKIDFNQEM